MPDAPSPMDHQDWAAAHVERFAQSAFRITTDAGLVVYIDIFEPLADPRPADLVLITHEHPDHFHPEVVKSVLKEGTRVVCPGSMKSRGADGGLATDVLTPGHQGVFAGLPVAAVAAYNLHAPFHPQDKEWVGYVVDLDGRRLYHAGDTDLTPELAAVKADLVLLPVGGLFTMGWEEAVKAAEALAPGVVIPMHYGKVPLTGEAGRKFAQHWSGLTLVLEP